MENSIWLQLDIDVVMAEFPKFLAHNGNENVGSSPIHITNKLDNFITCDIIS